MSAASAGAMRPSAARETAASGKERRSAMIDDLEELMLLIDAHRRGVAGLVAEAVKDVVDALRGRIDRDIDARLRRALSRCHAKSASGLRLTDFQAAATA